MSRRARHNTNVSLFPFLAVLLCAMGALLVLLVITTRQIRDDAVRQAQAKRVARTSKPIIREEQDEIEAWPSWEVELGATATLERRPLPKPAPAPLQAPKPDFVERETKPVPPDLTAELNTLRKQILRLQSQESNETEDLKSIRSKIVTAQAEIDKRQTILTNAQSALSEFQERDADLDSQLESLASQSRLLSEKLDRQKLKNRQLANAPRETPNVLKVVPYDGQHGTTRRPILIECTGGVIRFVPEGIELTERDLVGFSNRDNPLLSGVHAAEQYWIQDNQASGRSSRPYVLLIVRPDGIPAYYGARQLLQHYEQPFGYELVDQDQELVYPDITPSAKQAIELAVEQELQRRGNPPTIAKSLFPDYNPRELQQQLSQGDYLGGGFSRGSSSGSGFGDEESGPTAGNGNTPRRRFKFVQTSRGLQKVPLNDAEMREFRGTGQGSTNDRQGDNRSNEPHRLDPRVAEESRPITGTTSDEETFGSGTMKNVDQPTAANPTKSPSELSIFDEPGTDPPTKISDAFKAANAPDALTAIERDRQQSRSGQGVGNNSRSTGQVNPWTAKGEGGSQSSGTPSTTSQGQPGPVTSRPDTPSRKMPFERPLNVAISDRAMRIDDRKTIRIPENVETQELMKLTVEELRSRVQDWPEPPDQFYWRPQVKFYVYPNGGQNYERLKPYFEKQGLLSGVKYMGSLPNQEGSRN
ncbi:MAG: hypothetical protein HUJ26_04305 [Planctomycetaceae bacterium]|nr:hypothetical protein [Planctomycetaceae bacterium]